MPTLAAVIVPVRADVAGLPNEVRSGLTNAFRQSEPAVREGAAKHGSLFGRLFGSNASGSLSKGLGGALSSVGGQFSQMAGVATGALGVTTAGIGALVGAAAVMGTKTAANMEQAQIGFETLLGSGAKAQAFLSNLQQFAAATPFELPGLIDSSRLLLGVGVSAHDTMGILQAFGNASSAVGVGQENFQRIMLATSQAIGAGRFMTQDLNQITENGIPIWTVLSRAMGKPVPVLRQLASQGKLLSSDVLPVLERQMNRDYGGAMERQSRSLNGVWSTFMDTLNIGLANVLRPLIPVMTVGLTGATNVLSAALSVVPRLFSGGGAAGSAFGTVIRNLGGWITGQLAPALQRLYTQVMPALQSAVRSVGQAFRDHQEIVRAVGLLFRGLGLVLTNVLIPVFGLVLRVVLSTIGPAARVITTLLGGVSDVILALPGLVGNVANVGRRIVGSLVSGLTANPVAQAIGRIISAITAPFLGSARLLLRYGGDIIGGLATGITSQAVSRARDGLSAVLAAVVNAIKAPFVNANTMLSGAGADMVRGLAQGMGASAPDAARQAAAAKGTITSAFLAPSATPLVAGTLFGSVYAQGLTRGLIEAAGVIHSFIATQTRQMATLPGTMLAIGARAGQGLAAGLRTTTGLENAAAAAMVAAIRIPFNAAITFLSAPGVRIVSGLINGMRSQFGTLAGVLGLIHTTIIRSFTAAPTWLVNAGQRLVGGLVGGVRMSIPQLAGLIAGTLINVTIKRPFVGTVGWLTRPGASLMAGLINGVRSYFGSVSATIRTLINTYIRGPWSGSGRWLFNAGFNVIYGLLQGLKSAWGGVTRWVSGIAGWIRAHKGPLDLDARLLIPAGRAIMSGFLSGLQSGAGAAWDFVRSVGGQTVAQLRSALAPILGGGSGGTTYGAGVSQWSSVVLQALQMLGQPASWLGTVLARMQRESGGNPRAINNWDINAQRGDPSRGLMQTIGCVTVDTMILTRRGWLKHDEIKVGDETIGYDPSTGMSAWTPIMAVHHYDDAEVWRIGNGKWKADVTPNHRWWSDTRMVRAPETLDACPECGWAGRTDAKARRLGTRTTSRSVSTHRGRIHGTKDAPALTYRGEFVRTDRLRSDHRLRVAARADTGTTLPITPREAALLAWAAGDGTISIHGDITLWQSKPAGVASIEAVLDGIPHGRSVRQRAAHHLPAHAFRVRRAYSRELLARSRWRELGPEGFVLALDADQRHAWLDAMIAAEGYTVDGFTRIAQINGPLQDAIKLSVYLEGYRPTFSANSAERNGYQPAGVVGMARPHVAPGMFTPPEILPRQTVWCVTTGLGTWTAEQGGLAFLTGNSTFNAYAGPLRGRGIYDPLANVYAGLNYAIHTYGSLAALSRPGGYDAGGWLPPGGIGMNLTSRPERVLDPQQSEAYSAGRLGGNVHVTVMMDGQVIDDRVHVIVEDAVGELGSRVDNGVGG